MEVEKDSHVQKCMWLFFFKGMLVVRNQGEYNRVIKEWMQNIAQIYKFWRAYGSFKYIGMYI